MGCHLPLGFCCKIYFFIARSEASVLMYIFLFKLKSSSASLLVQIYLNFRNTFLHSGVHANSWFFHISYINGWAILEY